MVVNKFFLLFFLITGLTGFVYAQEGEEAVLPEENVEPAPAQLPSFSRGQVKLQDFETIIMSALRQQFPRIFTSVHSCRLPEYGPLLTLNLQLPTMIFTTPMLKELERRQKQAARQADLIRKQIERAAQMVRLKAREVELADDIEEISTKKKGKGLIAALQKELEEVRKSIKELEENITSNSASPGGPELFQDADLEKMIVESRKDLVKRITSLIKNVLAEKAPVLSEVNSKDRITIAAHIRDSFLANQERSIIFILSGSDIEAYRRGDLDLKSLKDKVRIEMEEE